MAVTPVKVGVIGCGAISNAYFTAKNVFPILDIVACADLMQERAEAKAKEHGIAKACSVDELIADPNIEIVLNLTVPKAHAEINLRAIEAGKHVYVEKPLATNREDGKKTMAAAKAKKVLVGCAPDTFFGNGIQTCRKVVDDGTIGKPIAATAFMMCHGHETWHPSPEFYYEIGGGPMFDMGPYYITAMVNLMGPVKRVSGAVRTTFPNRTIFSEPKKGKVITVETPTHIASTLEFESGAVGTVVMSFDVFRHGHSWIEVYGTEGSMKVPDPNGFGGQIFVNRMFEDWKEQPETQGHPEYQRGAGLADMSYAIRTGRKHRASGALAMHVLDIMAACLEAGDKGRYINLKSTCERPAAIPAGLAKGTLDE